MERECLVTFISETGRVTGRIVEGENVIKELSFFLGKLHQTEPSVVEEMIRSRYIDWAKVNGVTSIKVEFK